jgi:hypothetical protein
LAAQSRDVTVSPEQQIIRLGFGFAVSQALRAIADLEIADLLAAGEQSVDQLATQTGSHAGALYRVMRLLAAEGVFRETSARRFELTEVGRRCAPTEARARVILSGC